MQSLASAFRASEEVGEPLPNPFRELAAVPVDWRRAQLVMMASAPGVGKSILSMNLAVRSKVPTLVHSADTDAFTTTIRVGALLSGADQQVVEAALKAGHGSTYERLVAEKIQHIRWDFHTSPSIDDIGESVEAFGVVYGEYPHLVVVDNLTNLFSEDSDDMTAMRRHMDALKILAAESGACVVVLHHLTGPYEAGDVAPPLGALIGKLGKLPSVVLTLFRGKLYGDLGVCVVKNRFGPADPAGHKVRVYLPIDLGKGRVG